MSQMLPLGPVVGAGFGESVTRFFRFWNRFDGRASRSEFWWAYLFQSLLGAVVGVVLVVVMVVVVAVAASGSAQIGGADVITVTMLITITAIFVSSLILLVPYLAVMVRRLHDTNRSGLWCLLAFVPFGSWAVIVFCALDPDPAGARFDTAVSEMRESTAATGSVDG